jgi:DnaK suppressor protein
MKTEMIAKFKSLFEEQRRSLTYSHAVVHPDFMVQKDDLLDDVDLTTTELETSMRMRLRNRESLYAKKIDEALTRIAEGTFGLCGDCGDEIEMKRLEARPTATLCVNCKEEAEHREHLHIDGHRPKSLGAKLRLA